MILLFTLIELLILLAILVVLGILIYFGARIKMMLGKAPAATGGAVAPGYQLVWVSKQASFPKDTDASFIVQLQKLNPLNGNWSGSGGEDALIGAVNPSSVKITSINSQSPGTAITNASLPAGVLVYKTTTDPAGRINFVLRGSEAADAELFIFYVVSATDVKQLKAEFSVTDP
jgi:hypothetical protein